MKVMWLCNIMLPAVAGALGKEASNKEGWLTGLSEQILARQEKNRMELLVCFPVGKGEECVRGNTGKMEYFGFPEDTARPDRYDPELEGHLSGIADAFDPDVIHVFGTEYPHTLAMTKCERYRSRIVIGIQGICSLCARAYMADLPPKIQKRFLLRDILKWDNITIQQKKFIRRGQNERSALLNVRHVAGRTVWDRQALQSINPDARYHFLGETLRPDFYRAKWNPENCERYSIFMSQGDYPLKGLHYLLQALPGILDRYPDTKVYVAGNVITAYGTLKEKLKIGSYGKYCRDLIRKNHLEDVVHFTGRLDSAGMLKRYLKSHVYLSASSLENSPNSVGEAMLLGMPVISSDVGGVPSLLEGGEEGILYAAGDIEELAMAVFRIFSDDGTALSYGAAARAHALATHDPDSNYERLMEIYRDIMQENS